METKTLHAGLLLSVTLILSLGSGDVFGQDDGLYGSDAPDEAAFVRLANTGRDTEEQASLGGTDLGPVTLAEVSPYHPVQPGVYTVRVAGHSAELVDESAKYYTVALTDESLVVFADPEHTDPAEAQLFLYNLSGRPELRLVATERATDVTGSVEPGESTQVTVNPVAVELAIVANGEELSTIGDPGFERGESYSVFAFEPDEEFDAFIEQARVVTE